MIVFQNNTKLFRLTQIETIASKTQPSCPVMLRYVSPMAKARLLKTLAVVLLSHPPPPPLNPWLALTATRLPFLPLLTKITSFVTPSLQNEPFLYKELIFLLGTEQQLAGDTNPRPRQHLLLSRLPRKMMGIGELTEICKEVMVNRSFSE